MCQSLFIALYMLTQGTLMVLLVGLYSVTPSLQMQKPRYPAVK